jgi:hypothetical protein
MTSSASRAPAARRGPCQRACGGAAAALGASRVATLQQMYSDVERLRAFDKRARVVVSEPLNDLPGAFIEVPESTVAVLDESGYHHHPFLADEP